MLCETCFKIDFKHLDQWNNVGHIVTDKRNIAFEGDESYSSYYFHKPSILELKQSSMSGCHFCAVLWHAFVQPPDSWNGSRWDLTADAQHPIILGIWRYGVENWTDQTRPPIEPIWAYHGPQQAQLEFVPDISSMYYNILSVSGR